MWYSILEIYETIVFKVHRKKHDMYFYITLPHVTPSMLCCLVSRACLDIHCNHMIREIQRPLQIERIRAGYVDKRLRIYLLTLINDRPFGLFEIIVTQSSVFHINC